MSEYISCEMIEHGLDFGCDSIYFCCRTTDKGGGSKRLIQTYYGEILNMDRLFELKNHYRKLMREGKIIEECKNCIFLEKKEYDSENYISFINFNNWQNCNLRCVYCEQTHGYKPSRPQYNIYPFVKKLADEGYIRPGGDITIAGGEPTIAPEFEDLMNLFHDLKLSPIRVLTSGVKYSPAIERGIKAQTTNIMISVDSGTRDTYKWVKGFDFHDIVWKNLERYSSFQMQPFFVKAKYIIIPEINDNKEEITAFFNKCEETGLKHVAFDVELHWYNENNSNLPQKLFDLLEFCIKEAENRGLGFEPLDRAVMMIQKLNEHKDLDVKFRNKKIVPVKQKVSGFFNKLFSK